MPLQLPNLDDRSYTDLVTEARQLIPVYDPDWTNHNPSDPGITLIELFAYLTEMLLYRLDRVTLENQRRFLKLLNGPDWVPTADPAADVRTTVLAVRARERAVTAADFERLATDDFNRWLATMQRAEQGGGALEWWTVTLLDPTDRANFPSSVPPVARARCLPSRNLDRGTEAERTADAPAHVSLIVLPQTASTLAGARTRHTATLLPSGKVLVAGGAAGDTALASTEIYDPISNAWSVAGMLTGARTGHTATLLPSGKVLVAGEAVGSIALASAEPVSAELYDPVSNAWSTAGKLSSPRTGHTATLLPSGKVLVAGGADVSAELYDPTSNAWSAAGTLASARTGHTATLLPSGKVLVAGGATGSTALASAELYEPISNTWTVAGTLASARTGHTATLLPSGKVLVAGGAAGNTALASAELYDSISNTWSAAGTLAGARAGHTATPLPSAEVLVVGGAAGDAALASAELYDPASNTWSAAGALGTARADHTATFLVIAKLLVVAGDADGNSLASAELYDPDVGVLQPPVALQVAVRSYLDERRMLTTRHHVVGPRYAPISAEVVLARTSDTLTGGARDAVNARVKAALEGFLDRLTGGTQQDGWTFGRDVYVSELNQAIEAIPGVDYVTDIMLMSQCGAEAKRCVVAAPIWHPEGDLVGMRLLGHHLPVASIDLNAIVSAPNASFLPVVVTVKMTGLASTDPAALKQQAKRVSREFFHPLYGGRGAYTGQSSGLVLADLQSALVTIAGIAQVTFASPADPTRLTGPNSQLHLNAGEVVDWHTQFVVQDA